MELTMNYLTWNQDCSHLAISTPQGFKLFQTDPFTKTYEDLDVGDVALVEQLFTTSLIALVLSPRRLIIKNIKRNSTICELTFPTTVLAVRLNRKRLAVVLEDQIYLYDISNMKLIHTIDTSPNINGICALSPSSDHCFLAYPLPQRSTPSPSMSPSHIPPNSPHLAITSGHVLIFDAVSMQAVNVIEAHRAPLSCVVMNSSGTRLATASDKGTIIRVFSIPDSQKLFQFRRGSMPARILSMSFNMTSTLLCVSSATETIHIFRLSLSTAGDPSSSGAPLHGTRDLKRTLSNGGVQEETFNAGRIGLASTGADMTDRKHDGTFAGMIRRTSQTVGKSFAATVGGYLPNAVSEMLEPARDFAWFKIPKPTGGATSIRSVVAMSSNSPQVMIATNEGHFFVFTIDLENGGEGTLTKQHSYVFSTRCSNSADVKPGSSRLLTGREPFKEGLSKALRMGQIVKASMSAPEVVELRSESSDRSK